MERLAAAVLMAGISGGTMALGASDIERAVPEAKVQAIKPSVMPGFKQVELLVGGAPVAGWIDSGGRYLILGSVMDLSQQGRIVEGMGSKSMVARGSVPTSVPAPKIRLEDLPLGAAVKTVRGNGKRVLVVMSDPDCPACQALEGFLSKINNATIYTLPFALSQHPGAPAKVASVLCAAPAERENAWRNALRGQTGLPAGADAGLCGKKAEAAAQLAKVLQIAATPTLINARGERITGARSVAEIEAFIGG